MSMGSFKDAVEEQELESSSEVRSRVSPPPKPRRDGSKRPKKGKDSLNTPRRRRSGNDRDCHYVLHALLPCLQGHTLPSVAVIRCELVMPYSIC